jgi:hypothetical protein
MIKRIAVLAALLFTISLASAQGTLTVGFAGTHSSRGAFVDVTAVAALNVTSFAMNLAAGPVAVTVYTRTAAGATQSGDTTSAGAWTLLTTVNVTGNGQGVATGVTIPSVAVGAGQTRAFYLVTNADGNIFNANGPTTGASNAAMSFAGNWESHGLFASTFNGWGFQGTVCYDGGFCGAAAPPVAIQTPIPTLSEWALIAMMLLLGGVAMIQLRRRNQRMGA